MNDGVKIEGLDVMRQNYRELTQSEKDFMEAVKTKGLEFYTMIAGLQSREMSIAKTKIEEAVLWAIKGVTAVPAKPTSP